MHDGNLRDYDQVHQDSYVEGPVEQVDVRSASYTVQDLVQFKPDHADRNHTTNQRHQAEIEEPW
jgi:hypothetical protein